MGKIIFVFIGYFYFVQSSTAQNVGVGNTNPGYILDVSNRMRIRSGAGASTAGLYLNKSDNTNTVSFIGMLNDDYMGFFGVPFNAFGMVMNTSNGNVGIGTTNPAYKLDLSDRMRIRYGVSGTAGIYLNKADNTGELAFVGLKDDNYVGLFGIPLNNWGLLMNTNNGNIAVGNTAYPPQASLHIIKGSKTNGNLHPTSALIIEGDQGGWVQLSNNNNVEGGILSGNQQTFIRGAVIFGADSSLQFRTGGNNSRLIIDKTGDASFTGDASISGSANITGVANVGGSAYITGNVGIGNTSPAFKLDISDRMRIRYGGGANTAGMYLNKSNNTLGAFVGMKDDNNVGLFGVSSNNWSFVINTNTGDATFAASANISGAATITGSTVMAGSATVVGTANFSSNANITGNAVVTGEIRRPSTGSSNLVPICFGSVNSAGVIQSGTGNFSAASLAGGRYEITITGETYTGTDYCCQVTANTSEKRYVSSYSFNGKIRIEIADPFAIGTETPFHFIVYKP